MAAPLEPRLAAVLRSTGNAHHQAFADLDGHDPDWPLWYAERATDAVNAVLPRPITKSELVYWLVRGDREHRAQAPASDWAVFYARLMLAELAPG